MASVFWDHKGIILIEYLQQEETINTVRHCETLKNWKEQLKIKGGSVNERSLPAARQRQTSHGQCYEAIVGLIWMECFEYLNQPPYSLYLAPSDYHLFTSPKKHMGGKKCSTDMEVKSKRLLRGIKKWICRLTTCIERDGDFIEK